METNPTKTNPSKHPLAILPTNLQNCMQNNLKPPQQSSKNAPPNLLKLLNILPNKIPNPQNLAQNPVFFHTILCKNIKTHITCTQLISNAYQTHKNYANLQTIVTQ